jgi:hypothetical protein
VDVILCSTRETLKVLSGGYLSVSRKASNSRPFFHAQRITSRRRVSSRPPASARTLLRSPAQPPGKRQRSSITPLRDSNRDHSALDNSRGRKSRMSLSVASWMSIGSLVALLMDRLVQRLMSRVEDGAQLDSQHRRPWCDVLLPVVLNRHDFDFWRRTTIFLFPLLLLF